MKLATAMAMALFLTAAAFPAQAATIIVDAAGSGDHLTIQAGLDAANDGDTVEVVAGTYTGSGNKDLSFGTKNLTLVSQLGPDLTIIDNEGESGHRLFNFISTSQDTTCVVEGFTIQGGRFVQAGSPGAGIRIEIYCSPKIVNCIIRNNHTYGSSGGGVYVNNYCNPVFVSCVFESNTALSSGGGLYCSTNSQAMIRRCEFFSNQCSTGFGGGLAFNNTGLPVVRGCWFEGNASGDQGGGLGSWQTDATILNSVFVNNLATTSGGAYYSQDAEDDFFRCTFLKNRSLGEGSVYYAWQNGLPTFTDCIFAFSQPTGGRASTFYCDGTTSPQVVYCCSYGNPDGDTPCGDVMFSIESDPLFCDITRDDPTLAANSPCMPAGNPWGRSIGAYDQGCVLSPVTETSWGTIKAMYR